MLKTILFSLLLVSSSCLAADSLFTEGFARVEGFHGRKVIATGAVGVLLAGSLVDSYYAWWKGANKPFTFYNENWLGPPFLGIDKAGHFFTSYFYFNTFRNIMLWGGYSPSTSSWWAAGTAGFFALSIEIGDGLSEYGFSYQDLVFNAGGIGYGMLQAEYPFLRNFNVKWSYVPKEGYTFPPRFTEHYDAHTYWLTFNVNELLPSTVEPYWPDCLQVAVGYSVDDHMTKREAIIGLDLNLEVFSAPSEDVLLLQKTLNMFHLPMPAMKFTEGREPRSYLFHTN